MSADKKDLKYFLAHPDEMPDDPKEIERLSREHMVSAMESGAEQLNVDTIVGKQDEKKDESSTVKAEEKTETKVETKAEAKTEEKVEAKPEGVLAKDGKHIIPYSQLESARERAKAAEALAESQARELAVLKAAKEKPADAPATEMLSEEELEVLEADSPTLAKVIRSQQAILQTLTTKVQTVEARQVEQVATEEGAIKSEIQTAIDENQTLAGWQGSEDQTMWNEASKFDKLLRESPKYADVPFSERFAKVVELTQVALGLEAETKTEETPVLKTEDAKVEAGKILAAKAKSSRPTSLTQIPGGAPPAVDEKEKVEQMSPTALGQMFLGMTNEERIAYLEKL